MFYNALARKGKLADTDEDEIDNVVAMHNNMNEKTWSRILEWEKVCTTPSSNNRDDDTSTRHPPSKLLKFQGRPTDLSPKAMFKHYVLGHPLPYDRHDWTIVREDGTTVRYVIDYYYDESRARDTPESALPHLHDHDATPSLLVDVRPALDGPSALWNRMVTMPYAQRIAQSTKFVPLPMRPTPDMKSQVSESVQVWKNIKQQAGGKDSKESSVTQSNKLEEHQAKELAERFGRILRECSQQQQKMNKCHSEQDCARASMDLTMCMAKLVCPLQHESLVQALTTDDDQHGDGKIEVALNHVNECVLLQNQRHAAAKEQYPNLFQR